ncbi:MAG: ATP-grasp domain-containing protein [Candidatus Cryptobacteroides sp.]|nr:ATP-grasp domain-containing protein [Candidatus Cryptobacteroides sp.]
MAKKIGIIGGGQLGLMIAEEAHRQGALVYALDPAPDAPAFAECDGHIVAAYDNLGALEQLGDMTDVLTYEFENVPGDILRHLEGKYNIPQGIAPLFDSQDRLREKNNAKRHGLPVPDYVPLPACSSDEDCAEVPCELTDGQRREELSEAVKKVGMPCVLKTRRLGYDGHGQAVIREEKDIEKAAELLHVPCILEAFVPFDYECSVIMVRDGQKTIHFPIGRNIHKGGILDLCIVPAGTKLEPKIVGTCEKFMEGCDYRGILAIELFIKGNDFVFNEMAPRPHNSGHYTIEGCTSSQYTELCHFLLGQALEQPELVAPTVMKNILGQDLATTWKIIDTAHAEHWQNPAAVPVSNTAKGGKAYCGEAGKGVFVHIYGKSESRPKRKMAHITYVPMTQELFEKNWESKFVK